MAVCFGTQVKVSMWQHPVSSPQRWRMVQCGTYVFDVATIGMILGRGILHKASPYMRDMCAVTL